MATNGQVNTNAPVGALTLPIGQSVPPQQTTNVNVGGNLPSAGAVGTKSSSSIDIFDTQGRAIPATMTYTKTGADTWSLSVTVPDASGAAVQVGSANLTVGRGQQDLRPHDDRHAERGSAQRRRAHVRQQRAGDPRLRHAPLDAVRLG